MSLVFQEVDSTRRRRRVIQFSLIVCLSFGSLFFRLVDLQLINGDQFAERAIKNFVRREHIERREVTIFLTQRSSVTVHQPDLRTQYQCSSTTHQHWFLSWAPYCHSMRLKRRNLKRTSLKENQRRSTQRKIGSITIAARCRKNRGTEFYPRWPLHPDLI